MPCYFLIFRRMFPTVRVSFSGPLRQIQPADRYAVLLDIIPMDSKRYRYAYHRSAWLVAGKADPAPPARLYAHPDSPFSCEALRKQVISFEKVKLTNNEMDKNGQVRICGHFLNSLFQEITFVSRWYVWFNCKLCVSERVRVKHYYLPL